VILVTVEVASQNSRLIDLHIKHELYLREGVGEYWVVDPEARNVLRWRGHSDPGEILSEPRCGSSVLRGALARYEPPVQVAIVVVSDMRTAETDESRPLARWLLIQPGRTSYGANSSPWRCATIGYTHLSDK